VTVAPGITPPLLSVTAPEIEPVIVCPLIAMLNINSVSAANRISSRKRVVLNIGLLLQMLANTAGPISVATNSFLS
jgi:hypothetical protein